MILLFLLNGSRPLQIFLNCTKVYNKVYLQHIEKISLDFISSCSGFLIMLQLTLMTIRRYILQYSSQVDYNTIMDIPIK